MLGFAAISAIAISSLLDEWLVWLFAEGTVTAAEGFNYHLYAATQEFISLSTDTPPNQPFLGTLQQTIRVDRSLVGSNGFNQLNVSHGSARLINAEKDYDYLVGRYAMDGQIVTLKVGTPGGAYNSFFTMISLMATGFDVEESDLIIRLRDHSYKLEVAAQSSTYAGTGDLEGTSDLQGKRRPIALGELNNITPAFVIPAEGLFQVNDGSVQAIPFVYDQGYPLSGPQADFATVALLRAASITDGWYSTCLAQGYFRIGASAFGQITADVQGDNTGGYVNTSGTIVRRLISKVPASNLVDPNHLDTGSFANLEILQPAVIGYYLESSSGATLASAIADIFEKIGVASGFTRLGKFRVDLFTAPFGTPATTYDNVDVIDIARESLPSGIDPPPWRQRVAFSRNWTVITNPLAAVVETNPNRAAFLAKPYKLANPTNDGATILAGHLLAQDPEPIEAYFVNEADARAEADRLLTLFGSGYGLYRITVKDHPFVHDLAQCISVDYPRWNLDGGRLLRIVSVSENTDDNIVEIRAFG